MSDLIRLSELTVARTRQLFATAARYAHGDGPTTTGTVGMIMPDQQLHTRLGFQLGCAQMGLHTVDIPAQSLSGDQALTDTIGYLSQWLDLMVMSTDQITLVDRIAVIGELGVVNVATQSNQPVEVLGDLYALSALGRDPFTQRIVLIAPDCPLARGWAEASSALRLKVAQVCPDELANPGIAHTSNIFAALRSADLIITAPPGDHEHEMAPYRLEPEYLVVAKPDVLVSPNPPYARGREIAAPMLDEQHGWVGYGFKKHHTALYQAVMADCLGLDQA